MIRWKRAVGTAAVFALMSVVAIAEEAPREGGRGAGDTPRESRRRPAGEERGQPGLRGPEMQARISKLIEPAIIKQLVAELSIDEAKAKEVLAAYKEASQKTRDIMAKARESGDREKQREAFQQTQEINQKSLEGKLDESKARAALRILASAGQLQMPITLFIQANVEDAKIEKALPVLAKFQNDLLALRRSVGDASPEDRTARFNELRDKTAKELAPIVGEEAVTRWKELADRMSGLGRTRRTEGDQPPARREPVAP